MKSTTTGLSTHWRYSATLIAFCLSALVFTSSAGRAAEENKGDSGAILLTIFLKHDQSKTIDEIQTQLRKNGFYQSFPPQGVEVVSWYVMMGIGQVVTLRVPADKLRAVNLAIEHSAWGAYRTEFFASYDFKPVWEHEQKKSP
jgi:uncharacterized protein with GYD domain